MIENVHNSGKQKEEINWQWPTANMHPEHTARFKKKKKHSNCIKNICETARPQKVNRCVSNYGDKYKTGKQEKRLGMPGENVNQ